MLSQSESQLLDQLAQEHLPASELSDYRIYVEAGEIQLAVDLLADFSIEHEVRFDDLAVAFLTKHSDRHVFGDAGPVTS